MIGIKRMNRWIRRVAVVAGVALAVPAAQADSVELDAAPATPMILAGAKQTAYVRVALTGLATPEARRAPVNVAIVLDQSGSMQGRKIEEAKRAALLALEWLHDDDIVSVVTYQSTVNVLVPATKLRDGESVRRAISNIRAGGSTALFAGVSKGAREIRKFVDDERVNLVILLSDGLANVGPSSPGALADLGASLAREGIAVTTIGLGLGYNEDLMTRLAYRSDGNHFFVENARDLTTAYATEFGDLMSVVARDVKIFIRCPAGVRPVRVLGREAEIVGRNVHASMNQLYRDQTRYLILEVDVPAGRPGQVQRLADVEVTLTDLGEPGQVLMSDRLSVTFTDSPATVERTTNSAVMASVAGQLGAERAEIAMALRDAGKIEEARAAYEKNFQILAEQAEQFDDDALRRDAFSNEQAGKNLSEEDWSRERKAQQEYQLKTRQQRSYAGEGGEDKAKQEKKKND
jgi:Ca-activated chloride channel family protein